MPPENRLVKQIATHAPTWSIQTPTGAAGAIAVIQITAPSKEALDDSLVRLELPSIGIGEVRLANLLGVDRGIIARWSACSLHMMPHGGPEVLRRLTHALLAAGIAERAPADPRLAYPEARSLLEARVLDVLSRAASPLAIDLLLDQPRRWLAHEQGTLTRADDAHSACLSRLLDPPLVVALGAPNIGKSSLVNTLAGRGVAIVADEPGTTRDHVGVPLDLAGLVVRWVDTPGIRDDGSAMEQQAIRISLDLASRADLVLWCGDRLAPPPQITECNASTPSIRLALRSDLGMPAWAHDLALSADTGEGIERLVDRIRETLVPLAFIADPRPWRFWAAC
jgi:hypothetical protein